MQCTQTHFTLYVISTTSYSKATCFVKTSNILNLVLIYCRLPIPQFLVITVFTLYWFIEDGLDLTTNVVQIMQKDVIVKRASGIKEQIKKLWCNTNQYSWNMMKYYSVFLKYGVILISVLKIWCNTYQFSWNMM